MDQKKLFITRIAKNCTEPFLAKDVFTDVNKDNPKDLNGYSGKIIVWTPFKLNADETAAAGNDTIVVQPVSDVKLISNLIKANDLVTIGARDDEGTQYTVASVDDDALSVTMTGDLGIDYKDAEVVKVVWVVENCTFAVGEDGSTKNRIQYQMTAAQTARVYDKHRAVFRTLDDGGTLEREYPDNSYIWFVDIYDDINNDKLAT